MNHTLKYSMGGEQRAVLVYGPRKEYTIEMLVSIFGLWVKSDGSTSEDDRWDLLEQLDLILKPCGMTTQIHSNNVSWDETYIGYIVDDYLAFMQDSHKRAQIKAFCKLYKLPNPEFFGGIVGEYE